MPAWDFLSWRDRRILAPLLERACILEQEQGRETRESKSIDRGKKNMGKDQQEK